MDYPALKDYFQIKTSANSSANISIISGNKTSFASQTLNFSIWINSDRAERVCMPLQVIRYNNLH